MNDHQRLIELLDFSERAPTVKRNEQLKTYLKTHPLPTLLDVRAHPMRWNWGNGDRPMKVTPIFWALFTVFQRHRRRYNVRKERTEVLQKTIDILLRAGAKIDTKSTLFVVRHSKFTRIAIWNGEIEMHILSYIFRRHWGMIENSKHLIEFMLKRGADPNKAVLFNESALHQAVDQKSLGYARMLVKYGANVNARDAQGRTPIFDAVSHNNPEMVRFLLRAGASATLTDEHGDTPLHILFTDSRKNLSGRGWYYTNRRLAFQPEGRPEPGYRERFFKTLRLLMDHGVNPRKKNKYGETPSNLAEKFNAPADHNRIFTILKEKNRATARHALNKHLPNNVVQQILHRAGLTNIDELQGKRRNQETRRNRRLVKRRRT